MVTMYHPNIVIHNSSTSAVALLELTCPLVDYPLNSDHHPEAAIARSRIRKQSKLECQQLLAELDCLDFSNYYETFEARHYPLSYGDIGVSML